MDTLDALRDTLDALKHVIWPTRCAACDVLLAQSQRCLCERCVASVRATSDVPVPDGVDRSLAVFSYEGAVQVLISKWKYHEDYAARRALFECLQEHVRRVAPIVSSEACLVPVPPHPRRLRERGFDPVWMFAERLHKLLRQEGISTEFKDDVLTRTRHTSHQAGLSHDERMHNLDGAFMVTGQIRSPDVILVDDVTTTGATASACTQVLKKAGVERVGFIALAYSVR